MREKAGFASVCEAFGGLRFVNGVPGEPPVRPNLSIGDTLAGIHAALGILLAIIQRQKTEVDKSLTWRFSSDIQSFRSSSARIQRSGYYQATKWHNYYRHSPHEHLFVC